MTSIRRTGPRTTPSKLARRIRTMNRKAKSLGLTGDGELGVAGEPVAELIEPARPQTEGDAGYQRLMERLNYNAAVRENTASNCFFKSIPL